MTTEELQSALSQREDQLRRALAERDEQLVVFRKYEAELSQAIKDRDQAHADCAVMRGALEDAVKALQGSYDASEWPADGTSLVEQCAARIRVLLGSTNAGRDLLARYREAVSLLELTRTSPEPALMIEDWAKRRDNLLKTT